MNLKVEKLEGNMALLTIEAPAEDFEKAVQQAYLKNRSQINVTGFRKGKAPRAIIEKMYGAGIFFEDAANALIPQAYAEALETEEGKELKIESQPEIDVTQIGKGQSFIFTAKVALRPEVELGKYKGFRVAKKTAEVSDEDIAKELDRVREQNSRTVTVEDRPVKDGDMTVIDFEGFVDGEAFDGGKGTDYPLTIGSHSFIDTFEDQLIGKNIGEECEVNVTFPADYQAENLQGKPAMFKVTVKSIKEKELPELNDEFAEEISDFDTLDAYKEDIKNRLAERKQTELDNERRDEILKKAVENATMEIPEAMVEFQARQMVNEYAQRLQMQGLSLDMYMKYTGMTIESMTNDMKEQAKTRIQNSLVLEAIAKAENIEVSDEDVTAELEKMAKTYQMEVEKINEMMSEEDKNAIRRDLSMQKALDLIAK